MPPRHKPAPQTPICDAVRAQDGWNPNWEPFYRLDPQWTEKFMDMATLPMRQGVLDAKTIEFIAIAVDASCTHMYGPGVRRHIRMALELGATQEEIAAVLQLTSVLGIHTMSLAAPILEEELAHAHIRSGGNGAASHALPTN
ncbi:MAG: carboxymuconolactone decarboxylase family protein [Hydrogenophaga sp.]|nr:carboxymuconolactone decarboxylase family protein [Hydrogenophaga sp.]